LVSVNGCVALVLLTDTPLEVSDVGQTLTCAAPEPLSDTGDPVTVPLPVMATVPFA
jgi:hypothetical protein